MGAGRGTRPTMRALRPPVAKPMRTSEGFGVGLREALPPELQGALARGLREVQQAAKDATKDARQDARTRGRNLRVVFDPAITTSVDSNGTQTITELTVAHGLGRKPIGIEQRVERNAIKFTASTMTSRLITFDSFVGSGTFDFWVY